jgi:tryptophan synthase alpha chain
MRQITSLPLAVGFGISRPEHVAQTAELADAAVVGSAFVRIVERHRHDPSLEPSIESFARELSRSLPRKVAP